MSPLTMNKEGTLVSAAGTVSFIGINDKGMVVADWTVPAAEAVTISIRTQTDDGTVQFNKAWRASPGFDVKYATIQTVPVPSGTEVHPDVALLEEYDRAVS